MFAVTIICVEKRDVKDGGETGGTVPPVNLRTIAVGVALAPLLVVAAARLAPEVTPAGDLALIESYTIRAAHGSLLVGPYSRFQWHHPGPLYFYILAPVYRLSGQRSGVLPWIAVAINLAALVAVVELARRSANREMALGMAAALGLYVTRVPGLLASIWNAHVLVLPMIALSMMAAALDSFRSLRC